MSKIASLLSATLLAALVLVPGYARALGSDSFISGTRDAGGVALVDGRKTAILYRDANADSAIALALDDLQRDIQRVSGYKPALATAVEKLRGDVVIVGEIGKNTLIDQLVAAGKLEVGEVTGKREGYLLQVVEKPLPGVAQALVIAGSDRRGAAYGVYELSEQIGVSPWYWWADVPVKKSRHLYVDAGTRVADWPRVRYRGIFLNDEAPALTGWVQEKYGNYNHEFYGKVFELLMRLKANYLWPAMWNNAFSDDDPQNMVLAHARGIVMGTSHHEPMMRADKEWNRYGENFGNGAWDYASNPDGLYDFWTAGAKRNKPFDNIVTLGMRGQEDTPMSEEQNIGLLEKIVHDQREILGNVFDDRPLSEVPQLWALYKEVQGYYENGMRVPDDVTLLWSDDNWGNIRRLPTPEERKRSGGAGVYYHFDYVGEPRSYRWTNVTPIAKVWEQMNLAYAYGADRIWLVNVGDLKPQEFPMEFFLRLAWNPASWPKEKLVQYGQYWAAREFGGEYAPEIADLISAYTRHNGRRKPELVDADTYSQLNYREAETVEAELRAMVTQAETIYSKLDERYRDAFFQLVLHPVRASAIVSRLHLATGKNRLYGAQGRASTNAEANKVAALFREDAELAAEYHQLNGGKWNHFMSQPHIGYTHWNNPPANTLPATVRYTPHGEADMGVAVEGSAEFWPATGNLALPEFSPYGAATHYIELFNRGSKPFDFTAQPSADWIQLSASEGSVAQSTRLQVSIDWPRAPAGRSTESIFIRGTGWGGATIALDTFKPDAKAAAMVQGFVEAQGVVAIEAASFSRKQNRDGAAWEEIPLHGRSHSSISVFPVSDRVYRKPEQAPYVEYDLTLFTTGEISIQGIFAPSLNFQPGRGLRYAIALDDEKPKVVNILAGETHQSWAQAVSDGVRVATSSHQVSRPGPHTLRIYAVDPGVTMQKLIVDTGGLRHSFLGPPQSTYIQPDTRAAGGTTP
ncbi:glycosyl hydrolase 115 family protein [uncultured Microbulbifer sp.]|uniref:glycosyl hydrolase 115 family protein n=1 Tax=uncultured Microbulbifer sp. TaxID=348147 RepID=UPI0025F3BE94|nr:glycosyl hydrolase 115 family protein [uncultured Microbulbifer sp.]